jgi:hypothetical protein
MSNVSAPATPVSAYPWPADVLEFAAQQQVTVYLEPLLEATRRLFPTARRFEAKMYQDYELRDVRWINFEVDVPDTDMPNIVQARHGWSDELHRICPDPLTHNFVLIPHGVDHEPARFP